MGVDIRIQAGSDKEESQVEASGSTQHVITSDEREKVFKLTDDSLKSAVKKYFGKKPDDLFVSGPTPWNNLYQTNAWDEVSVHWIPTSAKIVSVSSRPTTATTTTFESSEALLETEPSSSSSSLPPGEDNTAIVAKPVSKDVAAVAKSSWSCSKTKVLPTNGQDKLSFQVEFLGAGDDAEGTSMSFTQAPGDEGAKKRNLVLGSKKTPLQVKVAKPQPEQPANKKKEKPIKAHLTAIQSTLRVCISYKVHLSGSLAVNYNKGFRGQHFWALDVQPVLSAAGIPSHVVVRQTVELSYHCHAYVECLGHRLPVTALSTGSPLLDPAESLGKKSRLRSLTSLASAGKERNSRGVAPKPSMMRIMEADQAQRHSDLQRKKQQQQQQKQKQQQKQSQSSQSSSQHKQSQTSGPFSAEESTTTKEETNSQKTKQQHSQSQSSQSSSTTTTQQKQSQSSVPEEPKAEQPRSAAEEEAEDKKTKSPSSQPPQEKEEESSSPPAEESPPSPPPKEKEEEEKVHSVESTPPASPEQEQQQQQQQLRSSAVSNLSSPSSVNE